MFASLPVAVRIEAAEARLTRSVGELLVQREPRTWVRAVGDGGGVGVATAFDSPFEKVIGAGFGESDVAALVAFEDGAHARGRKVRVEVSTLADPAFARALTLRGYVLEGHENVLGRAISDSDATSARVDGVEIREVSARDLETWIETVVDAFAAPDTGADAGAGAPEDFPRETLAQLLRDMASVPGYALMLALRGGEVAGGASMRVDGGLAQLTGAATLPAHRRHGVQTALLRERLRSARARSCDLAVVTTQPGSKSQENATRQGFALLYARSILVRDPPPRP